MQSGFEWIPTHTPSHAGGLEAHRVYPGLWQGSVPPTGSRVRNAGFDALVLCCLDSEYRTLYGVQPRSSLFGGMLVHRCPLDDGELTEDELRRASAAAVFAARVIKQNGRCLVTCHLGRNRSGLVNALTIRALTGASGAAAVEQVQRNRPGALTNHSFVRALRGLR